MNRTTLTKSLHTVTAVSRVALHWALANNVTCPMSPADADRCVRAALDLLGQPRDWPESDSTFAACVAKVRAMRGGK